MLGLVTVAVLLVCAMSLCVYTALRVLRSWKRQLTCHRGHTKRAARRGARLQMAYVSAALLLMLLCLVQLLADKHMDLLDESDFPAPLVSAVSASEGDAWAGRTNFLFRSSHLLCKRYSARQNSPTVPYERRLNDGTVETMDVSLYYYDADVTECAGEWLARGYARELARGEGAQPIVVAGADESWFVRKTINSWADIGVEWLPDEDEQCLIVRRGCRVTLVYYNGEGDLSAHADAYVQ